MRHLALLPTLLALALLTATNAGRWLVVFTDTRNVETTSSDIYGQFVAP